MGKGWLRERLLRLLRRVSGAVMARAYNRRCREAEAALPRVLPAAAEALRLQKERGGYHHHFSAWKLLELHQVLLEHRPRVILELGGGATTAVFAHYARANPGVQFYSVDQDQTWQDAARLLLPEDLRAVPKFLVCPAQPAHDGAGKLRGCHYGLGYVDALPQGCADLVYVDGPTRKPLGLDRDTPCLDALLFLERGTPPAHVLFDYRITSVHAFQERAWPEYRCDLHFTAEPADQFWVAGPPRHHSHFRRFGA